MAMPPAISRESRVFRARARGSVLAAAASNQRRLVDAVC